MAMANRLSASPPSIDPTVVGVEYILRATPSWRLCTRWTEPARVDMNMNSTSMPWA